MDTSPLAPSTGPQIRSRITVVCAECKRLKLKCDRRTPCGSCTKRDTVSRCIYSPAAAEKVDLHSLNNRLLQVEAALAQLAAGPSSSTYNNSYSNSPSNSHNGSALAVCNSGSSLSISIQDVLSIWLAELDINHSVLTTPTQLSSPPSSHVKLEPSHTSVPFDRHVLDSATGSSTLSPTLRLPPLSIYHLPSPFPSHASSASSAQQPQITPQLLALLPPLSTLDAVAPLMALHPCFNWRHFRDRVRRLLKFPLNVDGAREREIQRERPKSSEKDIKADTARAIFFGPPRPATRTPVTPLSSSKDKERDRDKYTSQPTISFFASAAAAFALGALLSSYGSTSVENQGEMPMIIDFVDGAPGANAGGAKMKKVRAKQPAPPKLSTTSASPSTSKASVRRPMHLSGSCSQSGPGSESCPESGLGSPAFLFALSTQALSVHEMSGAHFDVDYLQACVLQALFLLHCGCDETTGKGRSGEAEGERDGEESGNGNGRCNKGKGREMLGSAIFPLVGKMVNIARQMGLGTDPDEFPEPYSLFDAETRRRLWWDVYYYDLFVSDCMGHPPLIQDSSFSTKMPADADEDVFSPASVSVPVPVPMMGRAAGDSVVDGWCPTGFKYFELKCRLAQLVKTMKRRTCSKDPSSDPRELAYTLEQAAGFETEVRQWLAELPQPFWLDMSAADGVRRADGNVISPLDMSTSPMVSSSSTTTSPILVAHRCELAITANRLILKLYLPFLRPGACNNAFPPHQASHGTVNAAHVIIHASKVLYSVWKQHCHHQHHYYADVPEPMLTLTPAMFGFYSFGRTLFDAAVVCAHAAIKQPMTVWAGAALADVGAALDVMRDPIVAGAGSRGGAGMEGGIDEAVRVVEILQRKAEAARSGGGAAAAGMKRKHDEVEAGLAGFRLSSYGAATSVSGRGSPVHPRQHHHPQPGTVNADMPFSNPPPKFETAQKVTPGAGDGRQDGCEKVHSGKHLKKTQYPSVGVRVRPGKEGSPFVRDRHRSSSTATTSTTGSNEGRLYAPAPPQPPSLPITRGPLMTQPRTPVLEDSNYHHHSHRPSQQDSNQDVYHRSSLAQDIPMQQPESANVNDYSMPFGAGDDVQMDMNSLPRRRYSIHELQQQQSFPPDHPPTFDQPHPGAFDQPPQNTFGPDSIDRPCAVSSPYASRLETGSSSASSPYTSTGAAPSLLSTPTFGHNPSPPTFGHQPLHASPASYAPSPLANPSTHSFYLGGYDPQYNNAGMELGMDDNGHSGGHMGSAMANGPLYDKSHEIMYDVKASDSHHLRNGQALQANPRHMLSHNSGLPPQTWSREDGPGPQGEYWW